MDENQKRYEELRPRIPSGVGKGWQPIVGKAARALDYVAPEWQCDQVKEKFGGLRLYITLPEDLSEAGIIAADFIVAAAEQKCAYTCEICGKRGSRSIDNYWHKTLCDQHAEERKQQQI